MKQSKLPMYFLITVVALAVIYRIVSPPPADLPGPIGNFPTWKSIAARGEMASQATNPAGTIWAGAWNEKTGDNPGQSAVWIIDLNGFDAKSCALPAGAQVESIGWADDGTIRACYSDPNAKDKGPGVAYIEADTGKLTSSNLDANFSRVVSWPNGSNIFVGEITPPRQGSASVDSGGHSILAAASQPAKGGASKTIGQEVKFDLSKDASFAKEAGVAADGSSFVFSVSDPAAKDGKSFYLADTTTGTAKKAFDLGDVPGRVEGIWPSAAGVLMVCKVNDKLEDVLYTPTTGKLDVQPKGVDLSKWAGAPKTIAFTTYNGGMEFDLATGKTKTVFDTSKKDSVTDKGWRDFLRDSRIYTLKSGNIIAVSELGGVVDIRELKPNGDMVRALLSRM